MMKHWIVIFIFLLMIFGCGRSEMEKSAIESGIFTGIEIQKIKQAMPGGPQYRPAEKRRVLIFSLSWGFKHESIQWGKPMFDIMARKTGAFEAVFSENIAMFEPENLSQFHAVVFNNTNNEIFLPEYLDSLSTNQQAKAIEYDAALKKSLVDYLKGGGGLAVIHAGLASFREWPEFGEIIGARFDNHPWNAGTTVTLKKDEPDHPLIHTFPVDSKVTDEIYQFKDPYSREKCRVLISVDTSRTDMTVPNIHREDGDFPISWIKQYGKGRVFYCALGHEKHLFWDRDILQHLLDGIQYATGDLECDDSPIIKE
jgi:type 1 glutamine amidotransferase